MIVIIVICCIKARNRRKIEANQVSIENQKVYAQNYQVQGFPPQPYQCQINQTQNYNNPENYPGENNTHQTFDSSTAVVNQ